MATWDSSRRVLSGLETVHQGRLKDEWIGRLLKVEEPDLLTWVLAATDEAQRMQHRDRIEALLHHESGKVRLQVIDYFLDQRAGKALTSLLNDTDSEVRSAALETLQNIQKIRFNCLTPTLGMP